MQDLRVEIDATRMAFMQSNQIATPLPIGDFVSIMERVRSARNRHENIIVGRRSPDDVNRKHQVASELLVEKSLSLDQPVVGDRGKRVGSLFHEKFFGKRSR